MKAFKKVISKKNLYKEFVKILNGLLQLSGKETEVLTFLLQLNSEQKESKVRDILNTDNRRFIMSEMNLKKSNLSKYLKNLKSKGILLEDENGYYINDLFVPDVSGNISETVFILDLQ